MLRCLFSGVCLWILLSAGQVVCAVPLVVYFSLDEQIPADLDAMTAATVIGHSTADAAQMIAAKTGGTLVRIPPAVTYPPVMSEAMDVVSAQHKAGTIPELKDMELPAFSEDVQVVYLGFPVWLGRWPSEVDAFIEACKKELSVRIICPFITTSSLPPEQGISAIKARLPDAQFVGELVLVNTEDFDGPIGSWLDTQQAVKQ